MPEFRSSVTSLRRRATRARRIALATGASIIILVSYAFTFVVARFTHEVSFGEVQLSVAELAGTRMDAPQSFLTRIDRILDSNMGALVPARAASATVTPSPPMLSQGDLEKLKLQTDLLASLYERAKKATPENAAKPSGDSESWVTLVSTLALSIGVVGLLVFVLQIAVTFMRYYSRLAELYDAQADALDAADGSVDVAYQFIEKFSPMGVDFGAPVGTIYEKALEAMTEALKAKKP